MTEREKAYLIYKLLDDAGVPDSPDFNVEEWAALCEEAPMTFDIFVSCLEKCTDGNYSECYFGILNQFPEYGDQYDKYVEEKYGIKPMTPEEVEESWLRFKDAMSKKYGDDFK